MSTGPQDWDGARYDRLADPQARCGRTVLERLELTGTETVLDAGCGSGRVTQELLARLPGGRVVALDGSGSMLEQARVRLPGDRRVRFADIRVWTSPEPTPFPAGAPFADFLETVCLREHLATLPPAQRRLFAERVAAALPEPVIDYVRLNIIARRGTGQ